MSVREIRKRIRAQLDIVQNDVHRLKQIGERWNGQMLWLTGQEKALHEALKIVKIVQKQEANRGNT